MLNSEQIDHLFQFCRRHFVHHYDLQVEIVHHLANAIEEHMKNDTSLSFQKALEKVYESFGAAGFAPFISEKRKSVERQGRRLFWNLFTGHFGWPKILLLLLILSVGFTLFSINSNIYRVFYISVAIVCCLLEVNVVIKTRKENSYTGTKFLLAEFSQNIPLFSMFFYCFILSDAFQASFPPTSHGYFSIIFLTVLLGIIVLITIVNLQVSVSLKHKLRKDYPHVFAALN